MSIADLMTKFAKEVGAAERKFFFGMADAKNVAVTLREIADKVESGELLYHSARLGIVVPTDDYVFETFTIVFAPTKLNPKTELEEYKELYGPGKFPVAITKTSEAA